MTYLLAGSLLTGLAAGIIAGLFGVGGGLIVVPALLFLFYLDGIDPVISMHLALGTSLATIVFTNLSATWNHHRRGSVNWTMVAHFTPGVLLGAVFGSHIAALMAAFALKTLFGIFEIAVGLKMIQPVKPDSREVHGTLQPTTQTLIGVGIGALSTLFGIGGGTLSVPALTLLAGRPILEAVGTSSAIGIGLALVGTSGFIYEGWNHTALPPQAMGFVVPHAFLGIVMGSLITTPLGVRLAHHLDPVMLRRWFGLLLGVVGLKLLLP
ncbi:MAG: sulfite exporter TauE/SafE family protein [Magnetococcales bacterium]|nr:sulfite exporter TauE/SafE family protein [Magnetococcales bacterium]